MSPNKIPIVCVSVHTRISQHRSSELTQKVCTETTRLTRRFCEGRVDLLGILPEHVAPKPCTAVVQSTMGERIVELYYEGQVCQNCTQRLSLQRSAV